MSLSDQVIDIPIDSGLDNNTDDKLSQKLLDAQNVVYSKQGAVISREGYEKISPVDTDAVAITGLNKIEAVNNELLLFSNNSLYTHTPTTSEFVHKGRISLGTISRKFVNKEGTQQTAPQMVENGGIRAHAYINEDDEVRLSVVDTETGAYYLKDYDVNGVYPTTDAFSLFALGDYIVILYSFGTYIKYGYIDISDPSTISAASTLVRVVGTTNYKSWDAVVVDENLYVLYNDMYNTRIIINKFNSSFVSQGTVNIGSAYLYDVSDDPNSNMCNIFGYYSEEDSEYRIFAMWFELVGATSQMYGQLIDDSLNVETSRATIGSALTNASEKAFGIFGCYRHDSDNSKDYVHAYMNFYDISNTEYFVYTSLLDMTTPTWGSFSILQEDMQIITNPISLNNEPYIVVISEKDIQTTVYILTRTNSGAGTYSMDTIFAKLAQYTAGGISDFARVGEIVNNDSDNSIIFPVCIKTELSSGFYTEVGVAEYTISFNVTPNSITAQKNKLICGASLNIYDGGSITEYGFPFYPVIYQIASDSQTPGMTDGTYYAVAVYKYTDSNGNIYRSVPSAPVSITLSGGGSNQSFKVYLETWFPTKKNTIEIEVYRTENGGSIYYLDRTVELDGVTMIIECQETDANLISNEILYTSGGEVENVSPPACDFITTWDNRIWIGGLENKQRIMYSKLIREGIAPGFNESFYIDIDPRVGEVVGFHPMDDVFIIFGQYGIMYIGGTGPFDTGFDSQFTEPKFISSDVGLVNKESIVSGPNGIYFKSDKGIYLLQRNFSVEYIGKDVSNYNSLTISSARLLGDKNEIRFTSASGTSLVYNYYFGKWSVFTNENAVDSVVIGNDYYYITDTYIYKEDSSSYKDDSAYIPCKVSTGWIKFNSIQGFGRCKRMAILGSFGDAHTLQIKVYVDYVETAVQTETFSVNSTDHEDLYQFLVHIARQKSQAIRFDIETVEPESYEGDVNPFTWNGVSLRIGIKKGLNKMANERKT